MDHQTSLKQTNPLTSFLWGILAYSIRYHLIKMATIDVSGNSSSTMGMRSLNFSPIIEIILILMLAFLLLMFFLRPSVAWVNFALAGFIGILTGMLALFFPHLPADIHSQYSKCLARKISDPHRPDARQPWLSGFCHNVCQYRL